jgi:hypothetical protein
LLEILIEKKKIWNILTFFNINFLFDLIRWNKDI